MAATTIETVPVRHCDFEGKVTVGGDGPPVVYFHTAGGPRWDGFLDALAEHHTVYAPDHPGPRRDARARRSTASATCGTSCSSTTSCSTSSGWSEVPIIGSSFGGMVACELAAHRRARVPKLVLHGPDRAVARRRTRSPTT